VPSVRFSRDKRGYEYIYLVHTPTRRGKPGRTRVLYWYRTPPGVRIGRKPFDDEVQRTLERQNPGVTFDWETIINTPMPPPDMTEFWRERRRAEKAARLERRASESESGEAAVDQAPPLPTESDSAALVDADMLIETGPRIEESEVVDGAATASDDAPAEEGSAAAAGVDLTPGSTSKRRRRRRGGRRRRPSADGTDQAASADAADAPELADGSETIDSEEQSDEADRTSEEE